MADLPRWESFGGLTTLRREMDRLFERFLGRTLLPLPAVSNTHVTPDDMRRVSPSGRSLLRHREATAFPRVVEGCMDDRDWCAEWYCACS